MDTEPKLCRQCGTGHCAELWVICPSCVEKNAAYEAGLDKYRREIRFHTPYHRMKDTALTSKEHKNRSTRSKEAYSGDAVQEHHERNSRTDYHGYNYTDE